ncbi:MAG TPA: hypothetical protein VJB59_09525 [Bdellovibrionota bacterium]|nr:hypothetical protein [Bdellovibrionota bacterium]
MEEAFHNLANGPMELVNVAPAVELVALEIMSVSGLEGDRENFVKPFSQARVFFVLFAVSGGGFFHSGANALGEILGNIILAVVKPKFFKTASVMKTKIASRGARVLAKMSEFVNEFPLDLRKMDGFQENSLAENEKESTKLPSRWVEFILTASIPGIDR